MRRRIVDFIRAGNYEPFTSPTYVARLDQWPGFDIEVLRATRSLRRVEIPARSSISPPQVR